MAHSHSGSHATTYEQAIDDERVAKDAFFRSSPHSPLMANARGGFHGLSYFPVEPSYRIDGLRLLPYVGGGPLAFLMRTSDGQTRQATRAGSFVFEVGGHRQVLTAYRFGATDGDSLFVPFLDTTSGVETYGAGRYLDVEAGSDGGYVLDFNLAYHPYCAYSPSFSCPLTPGENRLGVRIDAGERLETTRH